MPKSCPQCDQRALHRSHRNRWQRMAAYVLPLRPYVCTECGHRGWRLLPREESRVWRIGAALALILLLGYGGWSLSRSLLSDAVTTEVALPAAPQLALALSESSLASVAPRTSAPEPKPAAAETPVPIEPPPVPVAPAVTAPPPVAKTQPAPPKPKPIVKAPPPPPEPKVLRDLSRQWDGQTLRVALVTDAVVRDAKVSSLREGDRYIIDVPGSWRLGAGVSNNIPVAESRVESLRTETRDGYLRVTLRLRDSAGAPPKVHATSDGLVIVLR